MDIITGRAPRGPFEFVPRPWAVGNKDLRTSPPIFVVHFEIPPFSNLFASAWLALLRLVVSASGQTGKSVQGAIHYIDPAAVTASALALTEPPILSLPPRSIATYRRKLCRV